MRPSFQQGAAQNNDIKMCWSRLKSHHTYKDRENDLPSKGDTLHKITFLGKSSRKKATSWTDHCPEISILPLWQRAFYPWLTATQAQARFDQEAGARTSKIPPISILCPTHHPTGRTEFILYEIIRWVDRLKKKKNHLHSTSQFPKWKNLISC